MKIIFKKIKIDKSIIIFIIYMIIKKEQIKIKDLNIQNQISIINLNKKINKINKFMNKKFLMIKIILKYKLNYKKPMIKILEFIMI